MIVQEYIREDGSSPFWSWFDDLDSQASAKVATAIVRMELGNLSNVKWIGGGLGEYRIDWGPGYRLYLAHNHPFLILPRGAWPHPWPRPECTDTNLTLAGELCTPKDVLARDVPIARARIGDLVCFLMAGAYGWDISHHDFLCHAHPERIYLNEAGA